MKKIILIGMTLVILVLFNYQIYQKENIKKSNDIVYLEIRPIDPRALIQGDYVEFAYVLGQHRQCTQDGKSGYAVISVDEKELVLLRGVIQERPYRVVNDYSIIISKV